MENAKLLPSIPKAHIENTTKEYGDIIKKAIKEAFSKLPISATSPKRLSKFAAIAFYVFLLPTLLLITSSCSKKAVNSNNQSDENNQNETTLIIISAPSVNDPYYSAVFDSIIAFDIQFANSIRGKDSVLILADNATIPYLQEKLTDDILLEANVADIWIRDFAPITTSKRVKFKYQPDYLSLSDARYIDNSFRNWFQSVGLTCDETDLILDGGNFVFNGQDKAIITERIFTDNPSYTPNEIDSTLKALLSLQEICYLPEEPGDISGHSDGMVMFASPNKVLVNTFDEPFRTQVLTALQNDLTDIEVIEMPYPYSDDTWNGWQSACGIYVNSLVTEGYVYMPTYGLSDDQSAMNLIETYFTGEIVPVDASNVCFMGGSVRCLTWVITGEDADNLIGLAKEH